MSDPRIKENNRGALEPETNIVVVMMRPLLEVCVDSVRSAKSAIDGGADRLEVCSCLPAGGLTPSIGLLRVVRSLNPDIPLMVMIRPRPGDFIYSDLDIIQMLAEIETIRAEGLADGFVTGALTPEGAVDEANCLKLLTACGSLPVTFHRAFDLTVDAVQSMELIIDLGFSRILTSGQSKNAKTGMEILKVLVQRAQDRIVIMAGCGINDKNVETILRETEIREIHSSASKQIKSCMEVSHETVCLGKSAGDEFTWNECDEKVVKAMVSIIKRTVFSYEGPNELNVEVKHESNNITSNGLKTTNGQTNGVSNGINGNH